MNKGLGSDVASWLETLRSADNSELPTHPSLLFFRHAGIEMAISASAVAAVDVVGFTHRVPHRRNDVFRGLSASEGDLVPLVNLEGLLAMPLAAAEEDRVPRLVVMEASPAGGRWSMIVDMVHGVDMCDPETWQETIEKDPCIKNMIPSEHGTARLLDPDELSRMALGAFQ